MTGNLTNRIGRIHKTLCLTGGAVGLLLALFPLWFVGKPLPILYLLRADTLLPPLWLMGLLWLGVYALWGAAAGGALACRGHGCHADALLWRGMTFLVIAITFSLAWYSLLFGSFLLLPSWLCLGGAAVSGVLCASPGSLRTGPPPFCLWRVSSGMAGCSFFSSLSSCTTESVFCTILPRPILFIK
jgi:hypothetical protein